MCLNAEDLISKIDILKLQIANYEKWHNFTIHVISIQECWYTGTRPIQLLEIDNYQMFHIPSNVGKKGGLIAYVHNSLTAEELSFFEDSPNKLWEGQSIKISNDDTLPKPITIHNVYRPPSKKYGLNSDIGGRANHDKFIKDTKQYLIKHKRKQAKNKHQDYTK